MVGAPQAGEPLDTLGSGVTALLGPTNTGKTHRAIERMLRHRSGMIGLPLRLLAREVYDRVTARIGERRVALVTGEEKRVPPRPDYWVCTVESMPVDREVDFLCVDEVQLAAHRQRGYTFTDRLLHARGRLETWFLGADTMRPLVEDLLPTAGIDTNPRFSRLSYAGAQTLGSLPPRTAVVAFSVADVYEIAERLRQRHGGTAVVLGALSPRTRNAQVAMYEAGEVQYMVATDAIGMGLNLDLDRVVFASLQKFDGKEVRPLESTELAQIAGRAGRYTRDGEFGVLKPCNALPPRVVESIEQHRFGPLRRLVWRNSDLDYASIQALVDSLRQRPRRSSLVLIEWAEDFEALTQLARMPEVRARAQSPEAVELLWDVCRIPDFRKLLLDSHVQLLARIFDQLSGPAGRIDPDWMGRRIARLDDAEGDIDTLMNRIAFIRTWTYIANHERWVHDAKHWQELTREVEDRQSDALHRRLTERFVEKEAKTVMSPRGRRRSPPKRAAAPVLVDPNHPFGKLAELTVPEPEAEDLDGDEHWVQAVVEAPHRKLQLDARGRIVFEDQPLARLRRGSDLLHPEITLLVEDLGAGAQSRLHRRLMAWSRDAVDELVGAIDRIDRQALRPAARGLLYQVEQGLGSVDVRFARDQLRALTPADRATLERSGVQVGRTAAFVPAAMTPASIRVRAALWSAYFEPDPVPELPPPGAVSVEVRDDVDPSFYPHIGFVIRGPRAFRIDQLEQAAEELHHVATQAPRFEPPASVSSRLACRRRQLGPLLRSLGYRRLDRRHWTSQG